jgi:hypothetical protein
MVFKSYPSHNLRWKSYNFLHLQSFADHIPYSHFPESRVLEKTFFPIIFSRFSVSHFLASHFPVSHLSVSHFLTTSILLFFISQSLVQSSQSSSIFANQKQEQIPSIIYNASTLTSKCHLSSFDHQRQLEKRKKQQSISKLKSPGEHCVYIIYLLYVK